MEKNSTSTLLISAIAAIGKNRELGKDGKLIWRIKSDLSRVRAITMGHPLIMGRQTYESIGRPLPGRTMIVLSRTTKKIEGAHVFSSLPDAIAYATSIEKKEIFIFGGERVYREALPRTHRLYLTLIDQEDPKADAYFPSYYGFTRIIEKEKKIDGAFSFTYLTLERDT